MSMVDELAEIDAEISTCHDKYLVAYFAGRRDEANKLGGEVDVWLAKRWAVMHTLDGMTTFTPERAESDQ